MCALGWKPLIGKRVSDSRRKRYGLRGWWVAGIVCGVVVGGAAGKSWAGGGREWGPSVVLTFNSPFFYGRDGWMDQSGGKRGGRWWVFHWWGQGEASASCPVWSESCRPTPPSWIHSSMVLMGAEGSILGHAECCEAVTGQRWGMAIYTGLLLRWLVGLPESAPPELC